jgi:serine/threonine-protein kinase HipA
LASNRDDHTRQHAYLMAPDGDWRLAPAFDLTYSTGPGGEHYLDIAGEGRGPTRTHVASLGPKHGLGAKLVAAMIDEARAAVAAWPRFAAEAGVSHASARMIAEAHGRVWDDFEP